MELSCRASVCSPWGPSSRTADLSDGLTWARGTGSRARSALSGQSPHRSCRGHHQAGLNDYD